MCDPFRVFAATRCVEHRFVAEQQALLSVVSGQAQALFLNYDAELSNQFGVEHSLATKLRFPVFIGSFTSVGEQALLQLRKRLPASLRTFVANDHAGLDPTISDDPRYELRLCILQELAPKDPDALAVRYTRYDLTEEERDPVEQLGRRAMVIVKERLRNVVGADELRPTQVVKQSARAYSPGSQWTTSASLEGVGGAAGQRCPTPGTHRREVRHLLHQAPGLSRWVRAWRAPERQ